MNIAIISDPHLGYAWGTEKQEDPFVQFEEAVKKAVGTADLVLLPGDIFDTRVPKQEIMEKAMKTLRVALDAQSSNVKIIESKNMSKVSEYTTAGVPVVAIHGNHERRGSLMVNPVETLAAGGLLVYVDEGFILFEKGGEKVAIHGLGAVPEHDAKDYLNEWSPKPLEGAYNILVLHQSFKEMLYEEIAFLDYSDLPKGFDLYVNGHIHWSSLDDANGKKILHPGSTAITQMKKREAEEPKGFYFLETPSGKLDFVELERQRKLYFKEFKFDKATPEQVLDEINEFLDAVPSSELKPSVKVKIKGSLQVGSSLDTSKLSRRFKDKLLLAMDDELESEDFKKKIASLRELHKQKVSITERGLAILKDNLAQAKYEGVAPSKVMGALEDGDSEKALTLVMSDEGRFNWKDHESSPEIAMEPVKEEPVKEKVEQKTSSEEKRVEPEEKKSKPKGQVSLADF